MSRSGSVGFVWGDGFHKFRLAVAQLEELEEKTGIGAEEILRRINAGTWHIAHLREPIRIGLIGGGMKPELAYKLVQRYASDPPFAHLIDTARAIMMAALIGAPDGERPGKRRAAKDAGEPMESSPSPPSMDPPLP